MVAVSDTSPVSNLALIGRLELDRIPSPDASTAINAAVEAGWLRPRHVGNMHLASALANDLDRGEAEAIALATELPADVLLIDEKEGRNVARQAGLVAKC